MFNLNNNSIVFSRRDLLPIFKRGYGTLFVSGFNLLPKPAHIIMAAFNFFIFSTFRYLSKKLTHQKCYCHLF